jgi:hypothetical protein
VGWSRVSVALLYHLGRIVVRRHGVDMSLTLRSANGAPGRRAHQRASLPRPRPYEVKNSATNPHDLPVVRKTLWMVSKLSTRTFESQTHHLAACGKKRPGYENQNGPHLLGSDSETFTPQTHSFPKTDSHFLPRKLSPRAHPSTKAVRAEWPPFRCETPKLPLRPLRKDAKPEKLLPRAASSRRSTFCRKAKLRPPRPDRRTFLLPRATMWQGRDFR